MKLEYTFWDLPEGPPTKQGCERILRDVRELWYIQLGLFWGTTGLMAFIAVPSKGPAASIFGFVGIFAGIFAMLVAFGFVGHLRAARDIKLRSDEIERFRSYADLFGDFPKFFTPNLLK